MNVVPRGPQVGDKTKIAKAGAPVLHTVKEHEERREAAPGNSREVMQRPESAEDVPATASSISYNFIRWGFTILP